MADLPVAADLIAPTVTEDQFKAALKLFIENVAGKDWINSNPLFKAGTIVAGNDFNNFTKSGLYVQWGNLTAGQLSNAPLTVGGQHPSGVLVVSNVSGNIATQIFYPYLETSKPVIRANATTTTWGSWDTFVFESTRYVRKDLTSGQDVLTLPAGRYKIPSGAIGNTLLNMPAAQYKYGIIDVDTIASYTIIRFVPYGRDTNFYVNSNYETGWIGWQTFSPTATLANMFATPAALSTAIAASLDNIVGTKFFGQQYTDTELNGTKLYTNGRYVGLNSITSTDAAVFNAVKTRIFNTDTGDIQYRVYLAPNVTANSSDGYAVTNVANYAFAGVCKSFPRNDTGSAQTILLDKVISIPANTPFVIVFKNVNFVQFSIGNHAAVTGNLESRGFNLSTSSLDWSSLSVIGNAGVSLSYVQAGFQLLIALASTSSGGSSGGGSTYTPTLVLPPKIYVLAGLESHIYPEHLLPENPELYLHDITCALGKQVKRGWVYTPATSQAAGSNALTWAIADRQTGFNITSASTTVVVAPQTTSGTKNVLVIGDSYINAGVITQRLLDIAATDPLKVTLIGTRGTGSNKHEGRGGWKVADYAGAGLSNYRFTVSGVTTAPAINSTTYTFNGTTYLVQEVAISGGSGAITASVYGGPVPTTVGGSGTLTKANAGLGDTTIAFNNWVELTGNPFWIGGALNFSQYLTNNSLATPDVVIIELGVNDCFSLTSDAAVEALTTTAFSQLDSLIASIKSANSSVKIGLAIPSVYANQDAFGIGYACGQTAWRAKRNIVTWNRKLIAYYSAKEAQNIYLVASGLNVDTENNFPTITQATNSQNATVITVQNNGVHPDISGYKQIGDALFAFLKAI